MSGDTHIQYKDKESNNWIDEYTATVPELNLETWHSWIEEARAKGPVRVIKILAEFPKEGEP